MITDTLQQWRLTNHCRIAFDEVMKKIWKEILTVMEGLLVPPLSDQPAEMKPLADKEVYIVIRWLKVRLLSNGLSVWPSEQTHRACSTSFTPRAPVSRLKSYRTLATTLFPRFPSSTIWAPMNSKSNVIERSINSSLRQPVLAVLLLLRFVIEPEAAVGW